MHILSVSGLGCHVEMEKTFCEATALTDLPRKRLRHIACISAQHGALDDGHGLKVWYYNGYGNRLHGTYSLMFVRNYTDE